MKAGGLERIRQGIKYGKYDYNPGGEDSSLWNYNSM